MVYSCCLSWTVSEKYTINGSQVRNSEWKMRNHSSTISTRLPRMAKPLSYWKVNHEPIGNLPLSHWKVNQEPIENLPVLEDPNLTIMTKITHVLPRLLAAYHCPRQAFWEAIWTLYSCCILMVQRPHISKNRPGRTNYLRLGMPNVLECAIDHGGMCREFRGSIKEYKRHRLEIKPASSLLPCLQFSNLSYVHVREAMGWSKTAYLCSQRFKGVPATLAKSRPLFTLNWLGMLQHRPQPPLFFDVFCAFSLCLWNICKACTMRGRKDLCANEDTDLLLCTRTCKTLLCTLCCNWMSHQVV